MVLAMAGFAIEDLVIKLVSVRLPVSQILIMLGLLSLVWFVVFELVWFGYPGLHRFALVYFGLLCFSLIEFGILHTMNHGQTRKKKYKRSGI